MVKFTMVAIYAPNTQSERVRFFKDVKISMQDYTIIMGEISIQYYIRWQFYSPKVYIPKVLYSEGSLFRGFYNMKVV